MLGLAAALVLGGLTLSDGSASAAVTDPGLGAVPTAYAQMTRTERRIMRKRMMRREMMREHRMHRHMMHRRTMRRM